MKQNQKVEPVLVALVKKHFPRDRLGQTEVFCTHWLNNDYFVGWHKKGDAEVRAYRITYPASAPAGFVSAGQARTFPVK